MKIARPLPECRTCETPTKRGVWLANGGQCSDCLEVVEVLAQTVRMTRLPPAPDQLTLDETVFVETYTPPVPGRADVEGER